MSELAVEQTPLDEALASPENLEKALVAKEQETELQHTPADVAALYFKRHLPVLKELARDLSAKQMRRVFMNVATFPLLGDKYKPQSELEKKACHFFNEMVTERIIMQLQVEQEKVLNAMEQKQTEQQAQEKGEENGI